ncbi:hypothetical protein BDQ17DRAFT_1542809 [Cyathus striatus]|nr:hypothetical protein BDQ17DRAFT_1542809 [Cyathus striatus]
MLEIPLEIWHRIASFLPDASVRGLLSVNRAFFYLSMGIRHRELVIDVYDHSVPERLMRFKDNMLNKYVKKLRINAQGIAECVESHIVVSSGSLLDIIVILEFLEELFIDVREHKSGSGYFPDDLRRFISTTWNSIPSSYLMRLHFQGSISSLNFAVPLKHALSALKELSLEFTDSLDDEPGSATNALLPFINGLSSQIRTLSIKCVEDSTGIWEFFEKIENFTLLETLKLNLNTLPYMISPGETFFSLQRFFSRSSVNVTSLTLSFGYLRLPGEARDLSPIWLSDDSTFRQLRMLDLHPDSLGTIPMEAFTTVISRCQHLLEDFTFRNCRTVASLSNTVEILKACSQLSVLTIYLCTNLMDIRVFNALSLLPLRNLTIYWRTYRGESYSQLCRAVIYLLWTLESCSYIHWELHDIAIYCNDNPLDLNIVSAIAHSIPSLRSLWGQDKNNMETNEILYERLLTGTDLEMVTDKHGCRGCKFDEAFNSYYPHADDGSCSMSSQSSRNSPVMVTIPHSI